MLEDSFMYIENDPKYINRIVSETWWYNVSFIVIHWPTMLHSTLCQFQGHFHLWYNSTELFLEILNDFHPGGFPDSKLQNEVCLTRISNYMERHGMKKQFWNYSTNDRTNKTRWNQGKFNYHHMSCICRLP